MKKLILGFISMALSNLALANGPALSFQKINMTQRFQNLQINLIGANAAYDGVDIFLQGVAGQDFTVLLRTQGDTTCKTVQAAQVSPSPVTSVVRVSASTDINSEAACFVTIQYKNGQKATIKLFSAMDS